MYRMSRRKVQGFTLIELMVVISIIGIITAVLLASFDEGRKQSRDKVRMAELKELQLAIELYKAQNGRYPAPDTSCGTDMSRWYGPGTVSTWGVNCTNYIAGLVPDYIAALPTDPNQEQEQDKGFQYRTDAGGTMYKVIIHNSVESVLITSQADEFSRIPEKCGVSTGNLFPNQYAVYSAGSIECL